MALYSGYWPDWSILAICQLSRDVIGYEDSSNYFWNDSWVQTFHSYTEQLVKIALSTLLRLCKWASVDERCLSQRVRGWNGYTSTPPPPSPLPHRCHRSTFMLTNDFKWSEWMKRFCNKLLFTINCHYYQKNNTPDIITIPTINLHYKNRGWIPAYSGMLVPAS